MRDRVVLVNTSNTACSSVARKLRAEHIYCRVLSADEALKDLRQPGAKGIIVPGDSNGEGTENPNYAALLDSGLPLLAMGDAALSLCVFLGGTLGEKASEPKVAQVHYAGEDPAFADVEDGERYFPALRTMNLPKGATAVAQAEEGILGFCMAESKTYGLSFCVEQNDPDGVTLLRNFCVTVCGCDSWWETGLVIEQARREIEECAGDGEAICALSGGVDSGVCAVIGNMVLGHRLHCVFVDTGLLRAEEGDRVATYFQDTMGLNFKRVDASERFLAALRGVTDASEKEQVVSNLLRTVLEEEVAAVPNVKLILEGTNYSDSLSHGLPVPEPTVIDGVHIVAPVRELFKNEVRDLAEEIGLASWMINRQPFPGSGLALRIFGEVTEEKLTILRQADALFRNELRQTGQNRRLWKYFATLAEDPAGQKDQPYVIILRAVQAVDGSSAIASRVSYDVLERACQSIREASPKVRRVLYDLTPSKGIAEIEWY